MASRLMLVGLWLAVLFFSIVPVLQPRGPYLGIYAYRDLAIGIPLAVVALWASAGFLLPREKRRRFAVASVAVLVPTALLFFALDAVYTLFVLGAWERNYWLDGGLISRVYNEPHSELGFARMAGISWRGSGRLADYRTDSNGFRNPPGLREADVVFIGDSYTEAAEVTEVQTFVSRVAEMTGLTTVNLGRGGYGPQQELIVLKRYGLHFSPQFVVWQVFGANDLIDAERFETWKQDPDSSGISLFRRYFNNSLTRRWLKDALNLPQVSGPPATLRYRNGGTKRISVRYRDRQFVRSDDPALAATQRTIEQAYRLCRDRGIEFLVVLIPTMLRVLAPDIDFDREPDRSQYTSPETMQDVDTALSDFCDRIGCPYINIEPALLEAAASDNRDLFIPSDEHLAPRGHQIVAREIAAWLAVRSAVRKQFR